MRTVLFLVISLFFSAAYAAVETDSVVIGDITLPGTSEAQADIAPITDSVGIKPLNPETAAMLSDPMFLQRISQPLFTYTPDGIPVPGRAALFSWDNGEIVATGGTAEMPGLMMIDSGTLGIHQSFGNFSFYAGGMANKYGYYHGLHTQYGIHASLSYRFSDRLSATVFGTYYTDRAPGMSPAMLGFYNRSAFGGYLDYSVNEHSGVEVGAQTVQQAGTRNYRFEPIATPYFQTGKGNKKLRIGLPVGQILYHVLR